MDIKQNWKVLAPRWIARIWSIVPVFIAVTHIIFPDEHSTGEPLTWDEYLNLGLLLICVVGLVIAWFNERRGSQLTLITLVLFAIAFLITVERSSVVIVFLLGLGIPAGLFYLAWWNDLRSQKASE